MRALFQYPRSTAGWLRLLNPINCILIPDGQGRLQGGKNLPRRFGDKAVSLFRRQVGIFPVQIPVLAAVITADVFTPDAESVLAENIHQIVAKPG